MDNQNTLRNGDKPADQRVLILVLMDNQNTTKFLFTARSIFVLILVLMDNQNTKCEGFSPLDVISS